jgi:hypothetical protein
MAVPAEKPVRKKTLEERRADVATERARMKSRVERVKDDGERVSTGVSAKDEVGWSEEDRDYVRRRRRDVVEENWDDVPDPAHDYEPPREWTDSIWLKIGAAVAVAIAFYIILQGWGDGIKIGG